MDREKSSLALGLGLLVFGIVILMFVLVTAVSLAASPGPFFDQQLGSSDTAPTAFFAWSSNNRTVTFSDMSSSGSAAIADWEWDFGDGGDAGTRDTTHTYPSDGEYTARLTVTDANGLQAVAGARVNVHDGTNGGSSENTGNFEFNGGEMLLPVGIGILVFGLYAVGFLCGGCLVKAGWNLIRPRPETIRIRIKPRYLEQMAAAEVAAPPPPMAPAVPMAYPVQNPMPVAPAPPPPEP